ncbi:MULTISPECIES: PIN domain nuclease [Streptomyces]|uniref:Ribonuclease VapC n=1 Tax=Streptomyces fradiae ATCC 10745 = DSM 40063 TaxID=1319510 RepID=A0A1Y2NWN9_STRFR|nr:MULTISPECIES: PIN domain nuclease [Streptomyces]KAF0651524.1 twitching motility protein PilT [Streptomyces fradiae ATCC 10745 = DSM 40063]OSY51730.1 Ribonuclease VapC21 [Streptomyces fradiae ATCC 10745 = DSM 40063]QEV13919.1 PIN domain nuclease [Streptomyces fradiae ATCC 10745 = DSM 40063]
MKGRYLIDKSALARRNRPAVRARLDALDRDGLLAVCAPTEYEVLYSARGKPEALRLRTLLRGFDYLPCNDAEFERALEIQTLALSAGFHRALSLADVLIAATAERHRATVLHYDGDFDMIASVCGLRAEWVVEPGAVD